MKNNSIYIIGATASGKSALAISLAKCLNGVIINADSIQVYSGANAITACPTEAEQSFVPHKLYNVINPSSDFNVVAWCKLAIQQADICFAQNTLPIFCGGTGFYATSFISGIAPIPDVTINIRTTVRQLGDELSSVELYKLLQCEDPIMAKKLVVGDTQRICRALEIIRSTGKSLAYYQNQPKQKLQTHIKPLVVGLLPDRQTVYDKINSRFVQMFDTGVAEVEKLLQMGLTDDSQLMRAIGIREITKYCRGIYDRKTAIENGKTATRQYAKRQMTYIRTQLNPDIIIDSPNDINLIANKFK